MVQSSHFFDEQAESEKVVNLYKKYIQDMKKFAISKLNKMGRSNCERDAEDIVHNSFVKIMKYANSIDFTVEEKMLKSYVFSIVSNETYNFLNGTKEIYNIDDLEEESDNTDFSVLLETKEEYDRVLKYLEKLEKKYRYVLYYKYCKDLTVKEIAELLQISEKTVYTRISRGKEALVSLMKVK